MIVTNPRRILLLSPQDTNIDPVLNSLLSPQPKSAPLSPPAKSSAELFHQITTPYYSASIPIWQETIPTTESWITEWKALPGAVEVVQAIGAWICVFDRPRDQANLTEIKDLLQGISTVIAHHLGNDPYADLGGSDAVLLAVGLPQRQLPALEVTDEQWEEACRCEGGVWEYVDSEGDGRNEFGELRGLPRMREALESAEWDGAGDIGDHGNEEEEEDLDQLLSDLKGADANAGHPKNRTKHPGVDGDHELQAELEKILGARDEDMKQPILGTRLERNPDASAAGEGKDGFGQEEDDVDDLQRMLLKLQAARDLGADLPRAERRKLAAKAVREVMGL